MKLVHVLTARLLEGRDCAVIQAFDVDGMRMPLPYGIALMPGETLTFKVEDGYLKAFYEEMTT